MEQNTYPKWMLVSNVENQWYKRYVVYEYNDAFYAITNAEKEEDLSNMIICHSLKKWKYGKELREESPNNKMTDIEKLMLTFKELLIKIQEK